MWVIKYDNGNIIELDEGDSQILDEYSLGNYRKGQNNSETFKSKLFSIFEIPRIHFIENKFINVLLGIEVRTAKNVTFINKRSNVKSINDASILSPYVYSIWGKNGVREDLGNFHSNVLHTWLTSDDRYREVLFGKLIVSPKKKDGEFKLDVRNRAGDQMSITRRVVPLTTNDTNTNWKIQGKDHLSQEVCDKLEEWLRSGTKNLEFFGYDFLFNAMIKYGDQPYLYTLISSQNNEQYHTVIVRRDVPVLKMEQVPKDSQGNPSFYNPETRKYFFDLPESKVVWKWMQSGRKHDVLFKSKLILRYDQDKSILKVADARTGVTTELIPQFAMVDSSEEEEEVDLPPVAPLALEEEKEESYPFQPRKQGFPPRKYQYEPKSSTVEYTSALEGCRADVSIRVDGNVILTWVKAGNQNLLLPEAKTTVLYPARVNDKNLSYYAELSNGKLFISNDAPRLTVVPIKNLLGYVYEWKDEKNEWTSFSEDVSFAIHDWKTKTLFMHEIVYRYDEKTAFVLTHSNWEGRIISDIPKTRKQEAQRTVRRIIIRYRARTYRIKTVF